MVWIMDESRSEMGRRRKVTNEFKLDAVKLAERGGGWVGYAGYKPAPPRTAREPRRHKGTKGSGRVRSSAPLRLRRMAFAARKRLLGEWIPPLRSE